MDQSEVKKSIQEIGVLNTARILGYRVDKPELLDLSGRLLIEDLYETAPSRVQEYLVLASGLLNREVREFMEQHSVELQEILDRYKEHDFHYDFFSASTLIRTYLLKLDADEDPIETPSLLFLRVAVQLYFDEGVEAVEKCFRGLVRGEYIHASPTLFNAGLRRPQMSSCFLSSIGDNLESILYNGIGDMGLISRHNGGLGIDVSKVRHSKIAGTGNSHGIIPMLELMEKLVRYVDQGGKRRGAASIFLRPHHIDVFEFVSLVDKRVREGEVRCFDLNVALWMPSLFWKRVREDREWTLFCPHHTESLNTLSGPEFEKEYERWEQESKVREQAFEEIAKAYKLLKNNLRKVTDRSSDEYRWTNDQMRALYPKYQEAKSRRVVYRTVKANDLLLHITGVQRRSGMPYLLNGDSCWMKSNHKHLGEVRSNLCVEIVERVGSGAVSSCNLASLSLKASVKNGAFDFAHLAESTRQAIRNLNKVVDHNWYPLESIKNTNQADRPLGLGVSGLAETFHLLDIPFVAEGDDTKPDPRASDLNKKIFACMYFNALAQSVDLALQDGKYSTFDGSPLSEGKLQFDLWKDQRELENRVSKEWTEEHDRPLDPESWNQPPYILSNGDVIQPSWDDLRRRIQEHGVRNSLLLALMPTATTAQVLQNTESFEPPMTNLYSRKVMNGAFPTICRTLVRDLEAIGLWNDLTIDYLRATSGSLQGFDKYILERRDAFPSWDGTIDRLNFLLRKYRTVWEISQRVLVRLSADRARYIDQSQSFNVFLADPTDRKLKILHLLTDECGLKTQAYYCRSCPAVETIKFTVDPSIAGYVNQTLVETGHVTKSTETQGCLMCQ